VAYEPEQRYAKDREHRNEIDRPFDSQQHSDRGQFWNVSRSVRGAATGTGLASGWWFAITDPFDLKDVLNGALGGDWFAMGCVLGGGLLGFMAAPLRRRVAGED